MDILRLLAVGLLSVALNVPLGMWRSRTKKFSVTWFVAIHLAVPLIYLIRTNLGLPGWASPILIAAAVLGQLVGGSLLQPVSQTKPKQYNSKAM